MEVVLFLGRDAPKALYPEKLINEPHPWQVCVLPSPIIMMSSTGWLDAPGQDHVHALVSPPGKLFHPPC